MQFKSFRLMLAFMILVGSAHAMDLSQLEADWCAQRISSRDALAPFTELAQDEELSADERLKARLYSMLCAAQCYNVIDTREAFRQLDAATTETANKLLMDFVRADLEGRDGPRDEAIETLEDLLRDHPGVPFARPVKWSLARFNLDAGHATRAFAWQDAAMADYEDTSRTVSLKANVYVQNTRMDEIDELIEQFRHATANPEADPTYQYLYAFQLMFDAYDDDAIAEFEVALELAPDHPLNLLARCKLSALYWETVQHDLCLETIDSILEQVDPYLDYELWSEATVYKANRLWHFGQYRESIETVFDLDRDDWNTNQRHRAESAIAEYFRRSLDKLQTMDESQHGLDPETIQILETRSQLAFEVIAANAEIWRPTSVLFTYFYNNRYQELIDYCNWAMENRHLSVTLKMHMIVFQAICHGRLGTPEDHIEALRLFEMIASMDPETQTAMNTLEWEFTLQDRDGYRLNAFVWLIQLHLNRGERDAARAYYDRMKYEIPWCRTKGELMLRYAPQLGD